jgi:hypothetical protein
MRLTGIGPCAQSRLARLHIIVVTLQADARRKRNQHGRTYPGWEVEHALQQCGAVSDDNDNDDNKSDDVRKAGMVSFGVRVCSSCQPALGAGRQEGLPA